MSSRAQPIRFAQTQVVPTIRRIRGAGYEIWLGEHNLWSPCSDRPVPRYFGPEDIWSDRKEGTTGALRRVAEAPEKGEIADPYLNARLFCGSPPVLAVSCIPLSLEPICHHP